MLVRPATIQSSDFGKVVQESIAQYSAHVALRSAWICGMAMGLLTLLANWDRNPVPMLADNRSFGILMLYLLVPSAFVVAAVAFVLGIRAWNERVVPDRQRHWRVAVVPVAVAHALLVFAISAISLQLVELAFAELTLDLVQAAFVVGLAGSALIYWLVLQAMQLSTGKLLSDVIVVLATGVYLSATNADDPLWWQVSFSYMGTMNSYAGLLFNGTLMFAGLLLIVWLPFLMSDLRILARHGISTEHSIRLLRYGLIALGIALAFVGLFPNRILPLFDTIHNLSAALLGLIFLALAVSLRRLIPGLALDVYAASWFLSLSMFGSIVFVFIGYFNTAGVTLVGGALAFTWMSIFVSSVENAAITLEPESFPK